MNEDDEVGVGAGGRNEDVQLRQDVKPEQEEQVQLRGEGEGDLGEQTEEEGEDRPKKKRKRSKRKGRKGHWKFIGHEPIHYELHPCYHRWQKVHPRGPCPRYKQIRWVTIPLSDRIKQLAMPLLRRLLNLWLEFGDKLPPEMKDRLLKYIADNYGMSPEFLNQILEEAVKVREQERKRKEKQKRKARGEQVSSDESEDEDDEDDEGGGGRRRRKKGKKGRKGKRRKGKGRRSRRGRRGKKRKRGKKGKKGKKRKKGKKGKKGKKRGKKGKKKRGRGEEEGEGRVRGKGKVRGEKKEPGSGLLFKRKAGKFPLDWAYKTGTRFIMSCISYLSRDPDEDYNSRAPEYFDVQSMIILELFCNSLGISLPHPERPTQYGEALVIMALNLSNWIAKYVTTPAQLIPDDKVAEYLDLRGMKPKKPKPKKSKEKKKKKKRHHHGKGKKDKKGKRKHVKKKKGEEEKKEEPEPVTQVQRNWEEHKVAVYVPEKSRISKRKNFEEEEQEDAGESDRKFREEFDDFARRNLTLDEVKREFIEYINWYNPWEPEFMYFGPRKSPEGIYMFKILDPDSDDVPSDLRILNWNQIDYGFRDNYSFIPSPVPEYYPSLRPLRPVRYNNLEKPKERSEDVQESVYDYSPWYLMSKALKPLPPVPVEDVNEEEVEGEVEEEIEDEMLESEKERPIQDSIWGDFVMKEQFELFGHLLHLMSSVPDLTIDYVFELFEEFCEAVACAEADENPSPENRLLLDKRTIILEQYFLEFFGRRFRDYNDRTPYYMRVICRRCAYYIQLLYECTARVLWELQSRPNRPSILVSRPETPDDPLALRDWDDWLEWLLRVTKTCDEWAGWISETVKEAEKKAAKKKNEYVGPDGTKVPLTAEEWFGWKSQVEQKVTEYRSSKKQIYKESPYYAEKAKTILPVKHRQKVCKAAEEEEGEGEGPWEGLSNITEGVNVGEVTTATTLLAEDTENETEWEDVGEVEGEDDGDDEDDK